MGSMPSIGRAFCSHGGFRTRPHTPPAARSARRTPAWLPCVGRWEPQAAFSSPYNRAAAGALRDIRRIVGQVRPQPAIAAPAALPFAAGCCGTAPTGAAVGQLLLESRGVLFRFTIRRLRRLTELNRTAYLASRRLPGETHVSADERRGLTPAPTERLTRLTRRRGGLLAPSRIRRSGSANRHEVPVQL